MRPCRPRGGTPSIAPTSRGKEPARGPAVALRKCHLQADQGPLQPVPPATEPPPTAAPPVLPRHQSPACRTPHMRKNGSSSSPNEPPVDAELLTCVAMLPPPTSSPHLAQSLAMSTSSASAAAPAATASSPMHSPSRCLTNPGRTFLKVVLHRAASLCDANGRSPPTEPLPAIPSPLSPDKTGSTALQATRMDLARTGSAACMAAGWVEGLGSVADTMASSVPSPPSQKRVHAAALAPIAYLQDIRHFEPSDSDKTPLHAPPDTAATNCSSCATAASPPDATRRLILGYAK